MKANEVLSKFFEARDVIHYAHFNTTSYAEHKALGEFYDGWLELVDTFVEMYQGRYQRIVGQININAESGADSVVYLNELRAFVSTEAMGVIVPAIDIDLANILADMLGLINHTLYLLTLK
jgi:hypothetical protein